MHGSVEGAGNQGVKGRKVSSSFSSGATLKTRSAETATFFLRNIGLAGRCDDILRRVVEECADVGHSGGQQAFARGFGGPGDVRSDQAVFGGQERIVRGRRFPAEDVESRAGEPSRLSASASAASSTSVGKRMVTAGQAFRIDQPPSGVSGTATRHRRARRVRRARHFARLRWAVANARSRSSRKRAMAATARPIAPYPTRPRVRPESSTSGVSQ